MVEIIPAIIPEDFEDLNDKLSRVKDLVPIAQIDVCDGKFVHSRSWPYGKGWKEFELILNEDDGLPFWQDLDFEIDLMVVHPQNVVEDWIRAGAKRIVLHYESTPNMKEVFENLRSKYGYSNDVPITLEFGIAINVKTPIDVLHQFLDLDKNGRSLVDFVQFMGIREVGYQGQYFVEEVLGKIRELRSAHPDAIISVDGGVNFENAHDIVEAGVNRLISGSALYDSEDMEVAIDEMRNI